ncbi:MAG TPA: hypothetical protein VJT78_10330 [Candidatus Dormibacteraeota bacterium]|nr:hypothetical protein [Candidatus Dormibacteraeota bacterium]
MSANHRSNGQTHGENEARRLVEDFIAGGRPASSNGRDRAASRPKRAPAAARL